MIKWLLLNLFYFPSQNLNFSECANYVFSRGQFAVILKLLMRFFKFKSPGRNAAENQLLIEYVLNWKIGIFLF